jgi:predicted RNase H-like HicB family nuclease
MAKQRPLPPAKGDLRVWQEITERSQGMDIADHTTQTCLPDPDVSSLGKKMVRNVCVIIERCPQTGLYVGYVPNIQGVHSQGATLDELCENLLEVLKTVASEGLQSEVIGVQLMSVLHEEREFKIRKNILILIEEDKLMVMDKNKKYK